MATEGDFFIMSEDSNTTAPTDGAGITDSGPDAATATAPAPESGQAAGAEQPGDSAETPHEDTIFDPREFAERVKALPAEVQAQAIALQKQLQGAYTKKTQALASDRQKIEAFDHFLTDPHGALDRFAKQYGYELRRPGQQQSQEPPQDWEPQNWNDVIARTRQEAEQAILQRLRPLVEQVRNQRKTVIEQQLSEIDPGWQQYEDKMRDNLQRHPTLAADPAMLYQLSVPKDVLEARYTQAALRKFEQKAKSAQVSSPSKTTKQQPSMPKVASFQDAVNQAKAALNPDGTIKPEYAHLYKGMA